MDERQSIAPPNGNEPVSEKGIIAQLALPRCVFFAFSGLDRSYYEACAVTVSRGGLIEAAKLGRVAGHSREARARPPCRRT